MFGENMVNVIITGKIWREMSGRNRDVNLGENQH